MGNGKNYGTVHWGKTPVNFRPQDFRRAEVEEAVRRATASFPDTLDLAPDFGLLAVLKDPGRDERAVLALGDGSVPTTFRRVADRGERTLLGLPGDVARRVRSRGS